MAPPLGETAGPYCIQLHVLLSGYPVMWLLGINSGAIKQISNTKTTNTCMYVNAHNSIIHNHPKLETVKMSTSWWMDTQKVESPCSGLLFNHKQAQTTDTHNSMGEPQKSYGKRKKQGTKGYRLNKFLSMTFWKRWNYRDRNQINDCQGPRAQDGQRSKHKGTLGGGGSFLHLYCRGCCCCC